MHCGISRWPVPVTDYAVGDWRNTVFASFSTTYRTLNDQGSALQPHYNLTDSSYELRALEVDDQALEDTGDDSSAILRRSISVLLEEEQQHEQQEYLEVSGPDMEELERSLANVAEMDELRTEVEASKAELVEMQEKYNDLIEKHRTALIDHAKLKFDFDKFKYRLNDVSTKLKRTLESFVAELDLLTSIGSQQCDSTSSHRDPDSSLTFIEGVLERLSDCRVNSSATQTRLELLRTMLIGTLDQLDVFVRLSPASRSKWLMKTASHRFQCSVVAAGDVQYSGHRMPDR